MGNCIQPDVDSSNRNHKKRKSSSSQNSRDVPSYPSIEDVINRNRYSSKDNNKLQKITG